MAKISLAMIARDREQQIAKALSSVAGHVDEIVVVLAGDSQDKTAEVARSFGARVIPFLPSEHPEAFYDDVEERFSRWKLPGPWSGRKALADFSAPRNLSFSECKGDYIFWIDSDDIVLNPERLRLIVERMEAEKMESVFMRYNYEHDEKGNCTVRQIRERIIRREDFLSGKVKWVQPIHEHLAGMKKGGLFDETLEVVIVHEQAPVAETKVRSGNLQIQVNHRDRVAFRNLKNLLIDLQKHEDRHEELHWRMMFYLGTEMRSVDPEAAIGYLEKYLEKSGWDEERAQARWFIGQTREMQLRHEDAWNYFCGAALDFPGNPAPWFGMARIAFLRGDWKGVIRWSEEGFAQVSEDIVRKPSLTLNPYEWRYRAHLCYSRALIEVDRIEDGLKSALTGLQAEPKCNYLLEHKRMAEERLGLLPENELQPFVEAA